MKFIQKFYLGLTHLPPSLNPTIYQNISNELRIYSNRIDAASGYAGSCHVLEMGRQYSEYVRYRGTFPSFRPIAGFPRSPYIEPLDTKSRASNITGNIGEIIGGIVAQRTLGFSPRGIAPLKAYTNSQTPDYLLKLTVRFERLLAEIEPSLQLVSLPKWWPMEAKARGDGGLSGAVKAALQQLAAYWYHIHKRQSQDVGYGIVIGTDFKHPRSVHVHLFIPSDQNALLTYIQNFRDYQAYHTAVHANLTAVGQYLRNYV